MNFLYSIGLLFAFSSVAGATCLSYDQVAQAAWKQLLDTDVSQVVTSFSDTFHLDHEFNSHKKTYHIRGVGNRDALSCSGPVDYDVDYSSEDPSDLGAYIEDLADVDGFSSICGKGAHIDLLVSCTGELLSAEWWEEEDPL